MERITKNLPWEYCGVTWIEHVTSNVVYSATYLARTPGAALNCFLEEAQPACEGSLKMHLSGEEIGIMSLPGTLRQLGIDGWELVGVTQNERPADGSVSKEYIFKRPLPSWE